MKLGCDTASFNQLDFNGALKYIAWAGYEGALIVSRKNGFGTSS